MLPFCQWLKLHVLAGVCTCHMSQVCAGAAVFRQAQQRCLEALLLGRPNTTHNLLQQPTQRMHIRLQLGCYAACQPHQPCCWCCWRHVTSARQGFGGCDSCVAASCMGPACLQCFKCNRQQSDMYCARSTCGELPSCGAKGQWRAWSRCGAFTARSLYIQPCDHCCQQWQQRGGWLCTRRSSAAAEQQCCCIQQHTPSTEHGKVHMLLALCLVHQNHQVVCHVAHAIECHVCFASIVHIRLWLS
jgi:hypothetical protein